MTNPTILWWYDAKSWFCIFSKYHVCITTLLFCLAGWMIKMFEMYYQRDWSDSKQKDQTGLVSSNPTGVSCKGIFRFLRRYVCGYFITKPKVVVSVSTAQPGPLAQPCIIVSGSGVGPRTLTFLARSKRHLRGVADVRALTQCLCSVIWRRVGLRVILVLVFTWWTRWLMKVWLWDSGRNVSNETNISWIALFLKWVTRSDSFCGPWGNPQTWNGCNLAC